MQHYDLHALMFERDRSIFHVVGEDITTPAMMSIADYKVLALAIHNLIDNQRELVKDLQKAEERIDTLERNLDAFSGAVCACIAGEEGVD
jgi:nitrogen fixation/metabolism regulation signal transduction histidine kinase